MYNKTIIGWGFCDNRNNQGLRKSKLIALASTLIIPDITKSLTQLLFKIADLLTVRFPAEKNYGRKVV